MGTESGGQGQSVRHSLGALMSLCRHTLTVIPITVTSMFIIITVVITIVVTIIENNSSNNSSNIVIIQLRGCQPTLGT